MIELARHAEKCQVLERFQAQISEAKVNMMYVACPIVPAPMDVGFGLQFRGRAMLPRWAYTIGMEDVYGKPELLVINQLGSALDPQKVLDVAINSAAAGGDPWTEGKIIDPRWASMLCSMLELHQFSFRLGSPLPRVMQLPSESRMDLVASDLEEAGLETSFEEIAFDAWSWN